MQQAAFQKEPGQFPLRGLVARRLVGRFSDTEQQAVGKQIFTFPDGQSFCMRKVIVSFPAGFTLLRQLHGLLKYKGVCTAAS